MMIGIFRVYRKIAGVLAGVMIPLSLAACSQPEPPPPPPIAMAPPKPVPRPAPPQPPPPTATESTFSADGPGKTDGPLASVKPPEPQEATEPKPQTAPSLAGLTEDDITKRFGKPANVRKTPSAVIWTYQDQACTRDLFMFPDMRSGQQKVLTYQLGGSGRDVLGERGCLERLGQNGKAG
jgi:hypothetical protein